MFGVIRRGNKDDATFYIQPNLRFNIWCLHPYIRYWYDFQRTKAIRENRIRTTCERYGKTNDMMTALKESLLNLLRITRNLL